MMRRPPRYTHGYIDRHGKPRWYLRRRGYQSVPLPGLPWSPEFMATYETALSGQEPRQIGASRTRPGSISALIIKFYRSGEWAGLAASTKVTYRGILERFRAVHGHRPVSALEREHIRAIIAKKARTPQAANNLRKIIRLLMRFAVEEGWRHDDPTVGVKAIKVRSDGIYTWSEDDIAAFEKHWPVGTKQRLALGLALFTGQRRSDLVRMGKQHVRNGCIDVTQRRTKTRASNPNSFRTANCARRHAVGALDLFDDGFRTSFTPAGFGGWFRAACDAAGLPKGTGSG